MLEEIAMCFVPDSGFLPVFQTPPTTHVRATPHLVDTARDAFLTDTKMTPVAV